MALKPLIKRSSDIFKDLSSRFIKTTSKISGSTNSAVSGGKVIAKETVANFATGVGSTARVGGKVFAATGIVGIPVIAGARIYDYIGDVSAKNEEMRQYDMLLKLAEKESDITQKARDAELKYLQKLKMLNDGQNSIIMGQSGGADNTGGYFPILGNLTDKSNDVLLSAQSTARTKSIIYGLLAMTVLGAGTYLYTKSKRK